MWLIVSTDRPHRSLEWADRHSGESRLRMGAACPSAPRREQRDERMIYLRPDDPPLVIGFLPPHIELPCEGGAWRVFLSYHSFRHICERRDNEHPAHRDLVLSRLSTVIADPSHLGCLSGDPNKLDLWAWREGDPSGVLVSLKCLIGETWLTTAFPLGRKSLRKHILHARLRPVKGA